MSTIYSAYFPIRTRIQALFTPAADDTQITTEACGLDRYWVDERDRPGVTDPQGAPVLVRNIYRPTAGDMLPIQELRGAIMAPRWKFLDQEDELTPCNGVGTMAASDWYDATTNPTGNWIAKWHQEAQAKVAAYWPGTIADANLRTVDAEPEDRSFVWRYRLLAQDDPDTQTGIRFYMGIASGVPQLVLQMLSPHPDDANSGMWLLYDLDESYNAQILDRRRQTFRGGPGSSLEARSDWLMVIPAASRLIIIGSQLDGAWVYAPAGGVTIQEGQVGAQIVGCRGWLEYGRVVYPSAVTMISENLTYGDQYTQAATIRVVAEVGTHDVSGTPTADASYTGTYSVTGSGGGVFTAQHGVEITNDSEEDEYPVSVAIGHRHTPILHSLQEIHEAVLSEGEWGPTDYSTYLTALSVRYSPTGRGHTADATFRNWTGPPEGLSAYTKGAAFGTEVYGMGRWRFNTQHITSQGGEDLLAAFDGYQAVLHPIPRTREHLLPGLGMELQDRTVLWDQCSPSIWMPDFAGWDFQDACLFLLEAWGTPESETEWPADYDSDPASVPYLGLSGATKFGPDVHLPEALDKLCGRVDYRWSIRPNGNVKFERTPITTGAPAFILDEDAANDRESIFLPCDVTIDYRKTRTMSYVRGRTSWGEDDEAIYSAGDAALVTDGTPQYVGRKRWIASVESDNSDPATTAQRRLLEVSKTIQRVRWRTLMTDLWFGDEVEVRIGSSLVPYGTVMVITGKTCEYKRPAKAGEDNRCWAEFECAIAGDEHV